MQNPLVPGAGVPALPSMAMTLENVTPEVTVTVLVTVETPGKPLLTVSITSQVPARVTGRFVV